MSSQTGSGAHPASYPKGTGENAAEDMKLTTNLQLGQKSRKYGYIHSLPPYAFME
jgi:hypothetical protein